MNRRCDDPGRYDGVASVHDDAMDSDDLKWFLAANEEHGFPFVPGGWRSFCEGKQIAILWKSWLTHR